MRGHLLRQPSPTPSIVYNGNDGGLLKSTDRGATWLPLNSGGLQTGLFYNISLRPNTPGKGKYTWVPFKTTASIQQLQQLETNGKDRIRGDGWDVALRGVDIRTGLSSTGFIRVDLQTHAYFAQPTMG